MCWVGLLDAASFLTSPRQDWLPVTENRGGSLALQHEGDVNDRTQETHRRYSLR